MQNDRVRAACEAIGRDPDDLVFSSALVLCVGRDEAEVTRRAEAIGHDKADLRKNQLGGTAEEVIDKVGRYAESGASPGSTCRPSTCTTSTTCGWWPMR